MESEVQRLVKTILVISNLYAPVELGGYEILARQICEDLVARGYRVVVLTTTGEERVQDGVEIWPRLELTEVVGRADDRSSLRRWRVHHRNKRATAHAITETQADAVLCFSLRRLTLGPAAAMEATDVARLYVINDAWPLAYRPRPHTKRARSHVAGWVDRRLLPSLTTLGASLSPALVLSQSLRDELAAGGVAANNANIVPQGVCTQRFRPIGKQTRRRTVRLLYAGQLHGYKGVHHIFEALKKLNGTAVGTAFSLTIAGQGDPLYEDKLRRAADRLCCKVHFQGHVPFEEMPGLYRAHDVLIFPSTWNEPMGLCHLEAMASGLPTVVASAGGCRELIERCPYILPYPAGDIDALAKTLLSLIKSGRRRRLTGEASRKWIESFASLAAYIDRIESELIGPCALATSAPMTPR